MIAERFDAFLFDLDGVVYLGDELLPGSEEALARLREAGKEVRFLTNDLRRRRRRGGRRGRDDHVRLGHRRLPATKRRRVRLRYR